MGNEKFRVMDRVGLSRVVISGTNEGDELERVTCWARTDSGKKCWHAKVASSEWITMEPSHRIHDQFAVLVCDKTRVVSQ